MFEVGQTYAFRTIEGGDECTFTGTVERYEHPLLKIKDSSFRVDIDTGSGVREGKPVFTHGEIINVVSPNFVSARRKD